MANIISFMQNGWKNIWRQNTIWLFSALPIFDPIFRAVQIKHELNPPWLLFYLVESFISIILIYVSLIGVPYLAYCFATGKSVTIRETLIAIRKFSGRVIGCSCLGLLLLSPCIFLAYAISTNNSTQPLQISNTATIFFFAASLFSAFFSFCIFGFFANDSSIRKSVGHAWDLFTSNFSVLATLGLIMMIISRMYVVMSGILTVLIQSGFDISSFRNLNYINPYLSLSKNIVYVLLSMIGQIIFTALNASVFALAYLKYSQVKIPS